MLISVTVASTESVASDTATLRTLLGTTSTADDARQLAALKAATKWAENYIGFPLFVQTYRETRPGFYSRRLMLTHTPVRAVPMLLDAASTDDGVEVLSSEYAVDREAGMLVRDDGWAWTAPIEFDLGPTPRAGQEQEPWLAEYVAGYTRDGIDTGSPNWSTEAGTTSTGRTLPYDIEEAVLTKAAALFEQAEGTDAEQLGDLKVTYNLRSASVDRQAPEETLLMPYRRLI